MPTGQLFTSNPGGLKYLTVDAELWQITRAGVTIPNAVQVQQLSPSNELFQTFVRRWRGKQPTEWWNEYENRFTEELKSEEKIKGLREVYKRLLMGKNVVLICFCNDHRYCHRRLVAELFEPHGVKAAELNPIRVEQISLF